MRQKLLRLLGWLAYAGLLVVIMGASAYFSFSAFVRRGAIPAPDLVGLTMEQSRAQLEMVGLEPRHLKDEDRFDDDMPAGMVVQQQPRAGSLVKQGGIVSIILSRGLQLVEVPEIEGLEEPSALTQLAASGLQAGRRTHVYWEGSEAGVVVSQSPEAGERVDQSRPVDLMVSIGDPSASFVMPDLVYRRIDEVRGFFERRGFKFGSVKYEPYEGVEEGVVLRHTPLAGHPLRKRDVITLVVATSVDSGAS